MAESKRARLRAAVHNGVERVQNFSTRQVGDLALFKACRSREASSSSEELQLEPVLPPTCAPPAKEGFVGDMLVPAGSGEAPQLKQTCAIGHVRFEAISEDAAADGLRNSTQSSAAEQYKNLPQSGRCSCLAFVGELCSPRRPGPASKENANSGKLDQDVSLRSQLSVFGVSFDESDVLQGVVSHHVPGRTASGSLMRALSRSKTWLLPPSVLKPVFHGQWVCTNTWGLEDFLKACNVGKLHRVAAMRAPWPSWEFIQEEDQITFLNKSPFGTICEEFTVDGPEYFVTDAKRQTIYSKAFWDSTKLIIERTGPQGKFKEERYIDENDIMHFTLYSLEAKYGNISWGRDFKKHGRPMQWQRPYA